MDNVLVRYIQATLDRRDGRTREMKNLVVEDKIKDENDLEVVDLH